MSDAKTIQVSLDGITYSTLPGSSGEISVETSENDNTIFGGVFASSLPGVRDWSFSGNAWFRETPGFEAKVKRAGTGTLFTDEAMAQVGTSQTYEIVDPTKNLWNFAEGVVISDGASAVADVDIKEIDYMFGRVTFVDGFTPTTVTADGEYLPTSAFGCANSVSLTQNAEATSTSCFEITQEENGFNTYDAGLKTVSAELSGFYRTTHDFFELLTTREQLILEIDWEGDGETISRGVFNVQSTSSSGDVGQQEEFSVALSLYVPEDVIPFSWYFGEGTKATVGMQNIMDAWITRQDLYVKYYPTGLDASGYEGQVVVTDCSMSTSVDAIGEMSLSGQGNGELVKVVV